MTHVHAQVDLNFEPLTWAMHTWKSLLYIGRLHVTWFFYCTLHNLLYIAITNIDEVLRKFCNAAEAAGVGKSPQALTAFNLNKNEMNLELHKEQFKRRPNNSFAKLRYLCIAYTAEM